MPLEEELELLDEELEEEELELEDDEELLVAPALVVTLIAGVSAEALPAASQARIEYA